MITSEKLQIFKKYDGDIDSWSRGGVKRGESSIEEKDWSDIDRLISALKIIKDGRASEKFKEEKYKELESLVPDREVQEQMKNYFEILDSEKKKNKKQMIVGFSICLVTYLLIHGIVNLIKQ